MAVSVDAVLYCRVEDPLQACINCSVFLLLLFCHLCILSQDPSFQAVIGNEDYLAATKFKVRCQIIVTTLILDVIPLKGVRIESTCCQCVSCHVCLQIF